MNEIKFTEAKMAGGWLCIKPDNVAAARKFVYEKKDKPYIGEIKQERQKRSLDANGYCWKLISEIAEAVRSSKEEVYVEMLRRYGKSAIVYLRKDVPPAEFFKYFDHEDTVKNMSVYKVYQGSSEYDTKEMSVLIDGVVSEAKELGIETLTPDELALMKARGAA